jgi:hypothetical protein
VWSHPRGAEAGERFVAQKIHPHDRRRGDAACDRRISRVCPASPGRHTQKRAAGLGRQSRRGLYLRRFADRIFTAADRNHDGHLDRSEFPAIQKADAALADADFDYFDENQDGKIMRKEFVDKPSVFILRFDRNGDCRVTGDEIKAAATPKEQAGPPERPRDVFH